MKRIVLAVCALMLGVVTTADAAVPYIVGDHIADFTLYNAYGTPVAV